MAKLEQQGSGERSQIHERASAQFGAAARAYSSSLTHSDPAALRQIVELAAPQPGDIALDVATGAGHTALALAPYVARVIAYDMTEPMLAETQRNASAKGFTNVEIRRGVAEALPFADASFDIVTVRQAPHHYADVRSAVLEMARVAKPGARIVIVDSVSPENERLDRQWNCMEVLRDPSHVRNYRASEWRGFVAGAGLRITFEELSMATEKGGPMSFSDWVQRIKTPPAAAAEVERLFREASPELAAFLGIQIDDGGTIFFSVPLITIAATKDR